MKLKNDTKIETVGFFGISGFGIQFLKNLIKSKYKISFVTSKHKSVLHISDIEKELISICHNNGLNFIGNVDCNDSSIVEICKKVDLCILGGYDKILRKDVLSAPKLGFINTHLGIIPENRGCNPSMWAILNNIDQGATTYFVNEKIDRGNIIEIQRLKNRDLNSYEAYCELSKITSSRIVSCLEKIEAGYSNIPIIGKERYHRKGMPNDGFVSWYWNDNFIKRFSDSLIFPPYAPMSTRIGLNTVHLIVRDFYNEKDTSKYPGTILSVSGNVIIVKTRESAVICETWNNDIALKPGNVFQFVSGKNHAIDPHFYKDFLI